MFIKRILLRGFRNIEEKQIEFSETLTVIVGENAKGKTNILEGVYCGVNGVGFRESREEELIQIGKEIFQIDLIEQGKQKKSQFRIILQKENKGESVLKLYFIELAKKTHRQYVQEQTRTVLFTPEHIEIITGSPEKRRSYLDKGIEVFNFAYKNHLHNYTHALRRRNKLLEQRKSDDEIVFWDEYLEKEGAFISDAREQYISFLNTHPRLDGKTFSVVYIPNRFTKQKLQEVRELEQKTRKTAIGPQKDDFSIHLKGKLDKDIHRFGSRSEQRLAIFWLKMNEITLCVEKLEIVPVLLLDDVFSEFDHENKERILRLIEKHQTIMTTTEEIFLEEIKKRIPSTKVIFV